MTAIILPGWLTRSLTALFVLAVLFLFNGSLTTTASMEPTLMIGDITFINRFENPTIGDVVSFKCTDHVKCGVESDEKVGHRLVAIEPDGCMHIVGDNQPIARDTLDYGCLMPGEIEIQGVEHPLTWWNNTFNR